MKISVKNSNKKLLLRERKRHTARRVAVASACNSGRGGSLCKNFFFQSEHVSSQIWCQKFFPLLGAGGPSVKIFFSSLNMYQAKSGVKNFSLYWGRVPLRNFFFQSEHVSSQIWCQKFFPILGGVPTPPEPVMGYPPDLQQGTPPPWTWDGVPPRPEMGYPPRPEMGYPPGPEMGYPPT